MARKLSQRVMTDTLMDVPRLIVAYYSDIPNPLMICQLTTSRHLVSSFENTFNKRHIFAITKAVCLYRVQGMDKQILSVPVFSSVLKVPTIVNSALAFPSIVDNRGRDK